MPIVRRDLRVVLFVFALALPGTALWGAATQATETRAFPVSPGDTLVVQNDHGRVRIQSAEIPEIQVRIRRIAATSRQLSNVSVRAEKRDTKIDIHSTFSRYQSESVYLDIKAPAFLNVVVWGARPAVEITGIGGYVRAYTQGGLVTATDLASSVSLTTESGNVLFHSRIQPERDIRLESVLGNIECRLVPDLNLRGWIRAGGLLSWNREVEFSQGQLEKQVGIGGPLLFASSLYGQVRVHFDLDPASEEAVAQAERESGVRVRPQPAPMPPQPEDPKPTNRSGSRPTLPTASNTPGIPAPLPEAETQPTTRDVEGGYSLRVDVNWTYLNVSVRDRYTNRSVPDLQKEDFLVFEDDTPQEVGQFESTEAPFNLLLLLDVSGSTKHSMDLIREASIEFTRQISPEDRIALATFNDRVRLVQRFTNDRAAVARALRRVRSDGGTSFYDALYETIHEYMSGIEGRKAIVVFTDGVDNSIPGQPGSGSDVRFGELFRSIQEVDTIIYSIFLDTQDGSRSPGRRPSRRSGGILGDILEDILRGGGPLGDEDAYRLAREQLQRIADQTGGRMYAPESIYDLGPTYREIADDLRIQYTLAYNSTNPNDGNWREIRVRIRDRQDLATRTRKGYYAPNL